ncbi:MAG: hypothetical protein ACREOZ_04220 [Gloeomargaritales cyanobacterium]
MARTPIAQTDRPTTTTIVTVPTSTGIAPTDVDIKVHRAANGVTSTKLATMIFQNVASYRIVCRCEV